MKTYPITLAQIEALADALAACDGHVHAGQDKLAIHLAHGILMAVLGDDEASIYGPEDEPEAPPRPIVAAVKAAVDASPIGSFCQLSPPSRPQTQKTPWPEIAISTAPTL